jgi:hypothetical protein
MSRLITQVSLKGLEPSTFCMASKPEGPAKSTYLQGKDRDLLRSLAARNPCSLRPSERPSDHLPTTKFRASGEWRKRQRGMGRVPVERIWCGCLWARCGFAVPRPGAC